MKNQSIFCVFSVWMILFSSYSGYAQKCIGEARGGDFRGVIVDLFNRPIIGSTIGVKRVGSVDFTFSELKNEAVFCLSDRRGVERVSVSAPGYVRREIDIILYNEVVPMQIGLDIGRVNEFVPFIVRGRIVDNLGRPVREALVMAFTPLNDRVSLQTASDDSGKFELSIRSPGSYVVIVNAVGFAMLSRGVTTTVPQVDSKPIVMNFSIKKL